MDTYLVKIRWKGIFFAKLKLNLNFNFSSSINISFIPLKMVLIFMEPEMVEMMQSLPQENVKLETGQLNLYLLYLPIIWFSLFKAHGQKPPSPTLII